MRSITRKGSVVAVLLAVLATMAALYAMETSASNDARLADLFTGEGCCPGHATDWDQRADSAQASLRNYYWNDEAGLHDHSYPLEENGTFHYWWQAHALDVLIDGYERSHDEAYLQRAEALLEGVVSRNKGITIDYYDDMLWMALAVLRLYEHTGEERYREVVGELWEDIQTGWNETYGGGIAWRKSQLDYKNTPSNAPAVILAARLYRAFGDSEDLDWAHRIYAWLNEHLVDPETGIVWDGVNRTGDGEIDKEWLFTYNQGIYIGASLELHRITDEAEYLKDANRTFVATADLLADEDGVLEERGEGDGGLFKGILVRYLGELVLHHPPAHSEEYTFIERNAESLWNTVEDRDKLLFPADWKGRPAFPLDLSIHLSGIMLTEQMARLDEAM